MHCRRCQTTMFETSVEAHSATVQQWFSCPLCAQQAVRTSYHTPPATKGDRSFGGVHRAAPGSGSPLSHQR